MASDPAGPRRREGLSPDTAKTSPLIQPGGRVDKGALFRAAVGAAGGRDAPPNQVPRVPADAPTPANRPGEIQPDDDLVEGLGVAARAVAGGEGADAEEASDGEDDLPLPGPAGSVGGGGEGAAAGGTQRVVFRLTRDLNKRLDKYLTDRIAFMSRTQLQRLIDAGGVQVNGRPGRASTKLRLADVVEVHVPTPEAEDVPPEDIPLDVLFEDEHLIVLNKSPDIIVHPARSHLRGTMINALAFHFRHRSASGGGLSGVGQEFARPGVVHRLDRQTSGVIVFAKTEHAHWLLAKQFMERTVDKRYVALVHGRVEPLVEVIDLPLGPHPSRERGYREKHVVRHDHLGKPAVTVYRVLGRYALPGRAGESVLGQGAAGQGDVRHGEGDAAAAAPGGPAAPGAGWAPAPGAATHDWEAEEARRRRALPYGRATDGRVSSGPDVSLVEVELKTGRTHQIRVHFSHLGWPLVADDMYGGKAIPGLAARVALHAALLRIRHPVTNEMMTFTAPFPGDLAGFLRALREGPREEPEETPGAVLGVRGLLG